MVWLEQKPDFLFQAMELTLQHDIVKKEKYSPVVNSKSSIVDIQKHSGQFPFDIW